jgi:O-antigen ligase
MKTLWLFCFPLLFLPNFGFAQRTSNGTLEVSDWLLMPFIFLLLLAPSAKYEQRISRLTPYMWSFLIWAFLSILTIHFRYDYRDDLPILLISCLKLARLSLYVFAATLIVRALHDPVVRRQWMWSLLASLAMLSIGLVINSRGNQTIQSSDAMEGYKSYNLTVVSVAILCAYIVGLWIDNVGTRRWRQVAVLVVALAGCAVVLSSSLTSHGRGGWLAFVVGFGYLMWKRIQDTRTLAVLMVLSVLSAAAYMALPTFKALINATLSPAKSTTSEEPVDDGARVWTWEHEAPKFVDAPVFGTGFYHRGGESTLWSTGSHNFFLQMFLETGFVGGSLLILIFYCAWRQACHPAARRNKVGIATRAALITAMTAGITGEYFYGGIGVLVLFAVLAMVTSLPITPFIYVRNRAGLRPVRLQTAS